MSKRPSSADANPAKRLLAPGDSMRESVGELTFMTSGVCRRDEDARKAAAINVFKYATKRGLVARSELASKDDIALVEQANAALDRYYEVEKKEVDAAVAAAQEEVQKAATVLRARREARQQLDAFQAKRVHVAHVIHAMTVITSMSTETGRVSTIGEAITAAPKMVALLHEAEEAWAKVAADSEHAVAPQDAAPAMSADRAAAAAAHLLNHQDANGEREQFAPNRETEK